MSPPIEQSVKQKVIELYTNGCSSPHDITETLNKQGIRISYGSVWNVINMHKKCQHERSSQLSESSQGQVSVSLQAPPEPNDGADIITAIPIKNMGSSLLTTASVGIELANKTNAKGGPLLCFLD
ncbi:MAG: hypothetical protein WBZ36_25135 [Candidatus Nitrosopolaris sp.]